MAGGTVSDDNRRPMGSVYASNSDFNAIAQQIETSKQKLETLFLARIDKCENQNEPKGSTTVNATPLTQMIDASGNAYKSPSYVKMPYYRIQQGIGAIILDPVPEDIGVFSAAKRDISNIQQGTTEPQPPASLRSFSPSDAVMIGSIHTKEPIVWIQINQDKTIVIHAPEGVTIETDKYIHCICDTLTADCKTSCTVNAPTVTVNSEDTTINATSTVNVNADSSCNVTAPEVNVNASSKVTIISPETEIQGHLTVTNGINVGGGSGAAAQINGSMAITGNVDSQSDVTASGISLNSHVHENGGGTGNSGRPV